MTALIMKSGTPGSFKLKALLYRAKGKIYRSLDEDSEGYKYLGISRRYKAFRDAVKGITETEYYCRVRKILKLKLNGGNVIAAINSKAVAVVR